MDQGVEEKPVTPSALDHNEFDALQQEDKVKWLVAHFLLDASLTLWLDLKLRKVIIKTLLQFSDVISVGGYGNTNLVSHSITVGPKTTSIKMKHWPLNPIMEESLKKQIDQWMMQNIIEEADSPWSFPLVPVPPKNSDKIRSAVDY